MNRSRVPVLLVAQELGQGGSERQLTELAKALDRERFVPHVGCLRPTGFRIEELRRCGVPVEVFPLRSFASLDVPRAGAALGRYVKRHGIGIVHSFDTPGNVLAAPAARMSGVPVVLSSQRAFRELNTALFRHLLRVTDQIADAVIVNCRALERHLVEDEKISPRRIRLCYNGIDSEIFHPGAGARPGPLVQAGIVVGVVCALRPEKDLPTLIDAFARVLPRYPGARLAIVGSGSERQPLEARARELGVAEATWLEPSTPEVVPWFSAIDVFVLPSRSEALSNSLMEAMACGCCAVASAVGGNCELVEHGETGLLFQPGSAGELAGHLEMLMRDESIRRRLAAAGRERMVREFSLAASARRMAEIYGEYLEDSLRWRSSP